MGLKVWSDFELLCRFSKPKETTENAFKFCGGELLAFIFDLHAALWKVHSSNGPNVANARCWPSYSIKFCIYSGKGEPKICR